ncbi:hypothetical protein Tco_0236365 [Tanacetum coccineum]
MENLFQNSLQFDKRLARAVWVACQKGRRGGLGIQENAANVIGLLGCDPESVEHMIDVGVCSVFDMLLKEGPMKLIKSTLKSNFTFKAETLKGVTINEPTSAHAKGNKNVSASKRNSTLAGKLKNVKTEDDIPLFIVMKELYDLKLQINRNQSSYYRNNKPQQVPKNSLQTKYKTQFKKSCELCEMNNHLSENGYNVVFCKKCKRIDHRTCDHAEYMSSMNMSQHLKSQGGSSSRSQTSRHLKPFPPCKHCEFNDHQSDECVNYPTCEICGSYDHDTKGYNRIISLKREIKPRNPQQVTKSCETCGSNVHTTNDHNDIEWFRRGEALQAKKAESSNATRSKTPTKRHMTGVKSYLHKYVEQSGLKVVFEDDSTCTTEGHGSSKCNDIVFTKVAFVNGLKYNIISIRQLCDSKYIVQFDEKKGIIFKSNKEVVMIAHKVRDVYVLDMTFSTQ